MKTLNALLLLFLLQFHLYAQPCSLNDLTLSSQASVDNFAANYPNCTTLAGSLVIQGSIENLDGLSQLTGIGNFLWIQDAPNLTDISGLQNVTAFGGDLIVTNCAALTNLNGLEGLSSSSFILIGLNPNLVDISGLNGLAPGAIGFMGIEENPQLAVCNEPFLCESLDGPPFLFVTNNAPGCNSVNEILLGCPNEVTCPPTGLLINSQEDIDNFVALYPNCTQLPASMVIESPTLTNLNGLEQLTSANGSVYVINNEMLENLNGLQNLVASGSGIRIDNNNMLTDLSGLENLQNVNGSLMVRFNDNLSDISALNNLSITSIQEFEIRGNSSLSACAEMFVCDLIDNGFPGSASFNANGCNSLSEISTACSGGIPCPTGDIIFNSQAEVDSFLIRYPNCTEIAGDVRLSPLAGIQNLNGLERIETITGDLRITKNSNLSVLGLNSLESVGGNLKIENTDLQDFRDLENLANIGGYFRIGYNPDLLTLSGLENLTTIPRLKIEFNPLLNNLNGLRNVNSINGYLKLRSNTSLLSLHGLANVNADEITELEIINNTALVLCDQNNICTYLETDKPRTIFNNSDGCNSEMDIQDNCANTACDNNDLILETQAEVDNFAVNYPDCIVWSANLSIQGGDITNLDGLSQLIAVEGNLSIEGTSVSSLAGLDQLIVIYGDFILENNNVFTYLEKIPFIGGSLIIQGNELLSDCAVATLCYHLGIGGTADISDNALGCESTTTVETACNATVQVCSSISNSSDDAEEKFIGSVHLGSSDLEMVLDGGFQAIGLRFLGLDIPKNATIQEANIQFTADQTDDMNPCQINFYGELSPSPQPFSNTLYNISNRVKTSNVVFWSPPGWEQKNERGPAQKTVDISPVLQEVVNQAGYSQNDPIVILIDGIGKRTADSFDGNPEGAAQLCLTYVENTNSASEYSDKNNNTFTLNKNWITVFPNPTSGLLQVDLSAYAGEVAVLQLHNSFGALVLVESLKEVPAAPLSLQLSHLPKGLYWISVRVGNERVETVKVLVD